MAKGLRSKVKVRARNIKRTDPNSDYVKVQQQRDAEIAARLAERKLELKTSDLERLQDIKERKEAGQEISEEDELFLQSEGKISEEPSTGEAMTVDEGNAAPATFTSLSKPSKVPKKGKKVAPKRTHKSGAAPKRRHPSERKKSASYI